jgi:KaiC/GvpD/RAD55 family RecA-like ATPase
MVKQDLIDRSPVRYFEKATKGGLKAGEIGVLTSKKGLGKTSVLVQIGLDTLLQDKQIVHVSFDQQSDYVMTWYEDIFAEIAKKKNITNVAEIKADFLRKRVILNFNQDTVVAAQIVRTLKALAEGGINTACLIIDGLDFGKVTADDMNVLKTFAKEAQAVIWFSCNAETSDISSVNKFIADKVDAVVYLEQKPDAIEMKILKAGVPVEGTNLKLDSKTLLIAEK